MKTIVCHGDSLTEGAEVEQSDTWPALAEKELNIRLVNSGISGDTTGGLLSRFYHDVIQYRPDILIIMAGTNDLWWDLSINRATYRENTFLKMGFIPTKMDTGGWQI